MKPLLLYDSATARPKFLHEMLFSTKADLWDVSGAWSGPASGCFLVRKICCGGRRSGSGRDAWNGRLDSNRRDSRQLIIYIIYPGPFKDKVAKDMVAYGR